MFASEPVLKSSMTKTSLPSVTKDSARCDPINQPRRVINNTLHNVLRYSLPDEKSTETCPYGAATE